ncbi:hypothetical protein GCU56_19450 [Geodermatophilus sabuli]|uniref:Uncharacterized protein n=1 Tax=Geodermatophilus sabuli TaxID=1564158 RepID=A0A7K3W562_9ACTN|nr:hypothetical protein [Geodermatophilus sabuli]NEK60035.1 hypothetical protein [Geodermatophilus sabuli]
MIADAVAQAAVAQDLGDWIWARHTNEFSWYIRPLFLLPMAWAAYRRSAWGIALSVLGLVTSMAWFPAPAEPDPQVLAFIEFEQQWVAADWSPSKIVFSLLAPLALVAYCTAFWRRSLTWGLVVLNAMALGKILWATVSEDGGVAVVVPALAGLAVGNVVLLLAVREVRRRRRREGAHPASIAR